MDTLSSWITCPKTKLSSSQNACAAISTEKPPARRLAMTASRYRSVSQPATLRYLDAVIASLRAGGFSVEMAAHAFWLLDSFVFGQVIQELSVSIEAARQGSAAGADELEQVDLTDFPHFAEVAASAVSSGYSVDAEFEFGLELVLDALDRIKAKESAR